MCSSAVCQDNEGTMCGSETGPRCAAVQHVKTLSVPRAIRDCSAMCCSAVCKGIVCTMCGSETGPHSAAVQHVKTLSVPRAIRDCSAVCCSAVCREDQCTRGVCKTLALQCAAVQLVKKSSIPSAIPEAAPRCAAVRYVVHSNVRRATLRLVFDTLAGDVAYRRRRFR